jgi:hypothetical protein
MSSPALNSIAHLRYLLQYLLEDYQSRMLVAKNPCFWSAVWKKLVSCGEQIDWRWKSPSILYANIQGQRWARRGPTLKEQSHGSADFDRKQRFRLSTFTFIFRAFASVDGLAGT